MIDQVWLVNAPVSTADARNLLLSFPTLLSDFLSMPSVFLPIFVIEDFVYASRLSQDSLIFSPLQLQLLEFHCIALPYWALTLLQPTDVSVYFQRNFIGLLLLIFSPAAVFSMSNLSIIHTFHYQAHTGIYPEPCYNLWQITSIQLSWDMMLKCKA